MHKNRSILICDTECYKNYWLIKFYDFLENKFFKFEIRENKFLDRAKLHQILYLNTIITFNGIHYDEPMITYALSGAACGQLKIASDLIIQGNLKYWEFYRHFNLDRIQGIDHIDIKDILKGVNVSLKTYGGRLNSRSLQDLPIHPDTILTADQMVEIDSYCGNDLLTTYDAYQNCKSAIDLRIGMSDIYKIDLRSKSDAQIAEAIIKSQLGFVPERPLWLHDTEFNYSPPDFIQNFNDPYLQRILEIVKNAKFRVSDKDQVDDVTGIKTGVIIPDEIKNLIITIGTTQYKMGIGGLHSKEKSVHYIANDNLSICDADVTSYYPSLILLCGICPPQLGIRFLDIYRQIYDGRLIAKNEGDMLKSDCYKIVLNGTFGKLGSKYSILFSPDLLIKVTLTGQLSLLMLILMLEKSGIKVVSANTDGVVMLCPKGYEFLRDEIVRFWEIITGLRMEFAQYQALYSRDVNNYIAIKSDGINKIKTKGIFSKASVDKNPQNNICVTAVIDYLHNRIPIEQTVYNCVDICQFLTVRNVKGGAVQVDYKELPDHAKKAELLLLSGFEKIISGKLTRWRSPFTKGDHTAGSAYKHACENMQRGKVSDVLGKVIRYYFACGHKGHIAYAKNGNRVPSSDGAMPLMTIPDDLPKNIDYEKYISLAKELLLDLSITYRYTISED